MGNWSDEISKVAKSRNLPVQDEKPQTKAKNTSMESKGHNEAKVTKRVLPLYSDLRHDDSKPREMEIGANTGLLFDKFCDHWSGQTKWKEQIYPRKKQDIPEKIRNTPTWDANPKTWFLKSIISHCNNHPKTGDILRSYHLRRAALIAALSGEVCTFKTSWRFVSGLGMGHVFETGFVWHRIIGVPYLPASSVKGVIRAWVDPEKGWGNGEGWNEFKRLFGDEKDTGAGSLIVFDAIPVTKPTLELDIMNPHYGDYYSKKIVKGQAVAPADYLSPNPIFFITVAPDVPFNFALAPRPGSGTQEDLTMGFDLLKEALTNLGAGAKTAVGYGYFK